MSDYRELPPPPALAEHLLCVWLRSGSDDPADLAPRVVPDGCADLVWIGGAEPIVVGPALRPLVVLLAPRTPVVGVRLRPGLAPALLGLPASELLDRSLPLRDLWREEAERLLAQGDRLPRAPERLAALELVVAERLPRAHPPDPLALAAVRHLVRHPAVRVSDLSRWLEVSERQLLRRFGAAVGYGPKTFQRVLRFQRLLRLARAPRFPGLADLAVAAGYADQAHMAREVARLAGVPSTALLRPRRGREMSDSFKTAPRLIGDTASRRFPAGGASLWLPPSISPPPNASSG